jgi:catechol 2,3-dioxygenase-like lactoylglutathione lyase family enzyme
MKGIFHAGITVSNLDRAIEFYRDVLGFTVEIEPTDIIEGEEVSKGLGVPKARLRLATLKAGDSTVELLEYLNPSSPIDQPMPPNALGAVHVSFQVDDAEAKMKELEVKGVKFLTSLNYVDEGPLNGWRWVYFKDPDGITLELIEYNPPKS